MLTGADRIQGRQNLKGFHPGPTRNVVRCLPEYTGSRREDPLRIPEKERNVSDYFKIEKHFFVVTKVIVK